jgi:geranylgeranyl pyrophosphate synthase
MRRFRDEAVSHLASFPDNPAKEALVLLADFVVERKK